MVILSERCRANGEKKSESELEGDTTEFVNALDVKDEKKNEEQWLVFWPGKVEELSCRVLSWEGKNTFNQKNSELGFLDSKSLRCLLDFYLIMAYLDILVFRGKVGHGAGSEYLNLKAKWGLLWDIGI